MYGRNVLGTNDVSLYLPNAKRVRNGRRIQIFADERDFRWRPRFSPTGEIFVDGRDFRRRARFSPAVQIFLNQIKRKSKRKRKRKLKRGNLGREAPWLLPPFRFRFRFRFDLRLI